MSSNSASFQDVAGHVAGTDAEFEDIGVRDAELVHLVEDHVEQGQPRRGGDETIGPALDEGRIMEFVLGTDETGHMGSSNQSDTKRPP